jgi:hypothetical protein
VSCTEKAEVWDSSTLDFAGEWWAEHSVNGEGSGMGTLQTFNTTANDGKEIWITDNKTFWDYKVKCPIDKKTLTFSGKDLQNFAYDSKVTITDGKILKNAAHSKSGVVVDSIYYKVSFDDDDPGKVYEVKGLLKTGFAEDAY